MKIEWDKIVTQAVTVVVVSTFLGAATIVWKGATSVDTKVQQTREDVQYLIDSLSEQLANFQVQLVAISNQITLVNTEVKMRKGEPDDFPPAPPAAFEPPPILEDNKIMQQKAFKNDFLQQLKK